MKKWLLVLGMITCIFGMSACGGGKEEESKLDITVEQAEYLGEQAVLSVIALCEEPELADKKAEFSSDPIWAAAISSWESAKTDIGDYGKILEKTVVINKDDVIINVKVDGTEHDANIEVILGEDLYISSITTNVEYSFGELMKKAGLNTLLGMGTVFVVLILISLIISCFGIIPKIQAAFAKKPQEEEKNVAETTVDNTIAQIVEKEELSDDLELVAVIAAAIAASEGATSTDGFVVRSIRKRRY